MRSIYCLLLGVFIAAALHGQNCKILDNTSFFTGIRFGNQIPRDLFLCTKQQAVQYQYFSNYRIEYDSLNQDCKKRYSDIFTFLSIPFSFLQISTNTKGQISLVQLYSFFNDNRGDDSMIYDPPANFTEAYDKLISLYGKPTRTEGATATDSLFIKELGMPRTVVWECNNIFLQLMVRYGSQHKDINVIVIQVTDRRFDIPEQELLNSK